MPATPPIPEEFEPITTARAKLPSLVKEAEGREKTYILTRNGRPRAVLLGYDDYRSLRAAAEAASDPEILEKIWRGQAEARSGETVGPEQFEQRLKSSRDHQPPPKKERRSRLKLPAAEREDIEEALRRKAEEFLESTRRSGESPKRGPQGRLALRAGRRKPPQKVIEAQSHQQAVLTRSMDLIRSLVDLSARSIARAAALEAEERQK